MLAQVRLLLHVVEESAQRAPVHPREAGAVALAAPADEVTQALRVPAVRLGREPTPSAPFRDELRRIR